jgi:hypothetical protein
MQNKRPPSKSSIQKLIQCGPGEKKKKKKRLNFQKELIPPNQFNFFLLSVVLGIKSLTCLGKALSHELHPQRVPTDSKPKGKRDRVDHGMEECFKSSGSGRFTHRLLTVLVLLFFITILITPWAREVIFSIGVRYQTTFLL